LNFVRPSYVLFFNNGTSSSTKKILELIIFFVLTKILFFTAPTNLMIFLFHVQFTSRNIGRQHQTWFYDFDFFKIKFYKVIFLNENSFSQKLKLYKQNLKFFVFKNLTGNFFPGVNLVISPQFEEPERRRKIPVPGQLWSHAFQLVTKNVTGF